MAEFKVFNSNVDVNIGTVKAFSDSMKRGRDARVAILKKHGIDLDNGEWVSQQKWLDAFKEVAENIGDMTLFLIGTAIIDNAKFPPIKNLKEGLESINIAYHMNHRLDDQIMFNPATGQILEGIGDYKLTAYNEDERKAEMVCKNPYPSKFDEGIINAVVRRFGPSDSKRALVKVDVTKERRTKGGDSCTYLISW